MCDVRDAAGRWIDSRSLVNAKSAMGQIEVMDGGRMMECLLDASSPVVATLVSRHMS